MSVGRFSLKTSSLQTDLVQLALVLWRRVSREIRDACLRLCGHLLPWWARPHSLGRSAPSSLLGPAQCWPQPWQHLCTFLPHLKCPTSALWGRAVGGLAKGKGAEQKGAVLLSSETGLRLAPKLDGPGLTVTHRSKAPVRLLRESRHWGEGHSPQKGMCGEQEHACATHTPFPLPPAPDHKKQDLRLTGGSCLHSLCTRYS